MERMVEGVVVWLGMVLGLAITLRYHGLAYPLEGNLQDTIDLRMRVF